MMSRHHGPKMYSNSQLVPTAVIFVLLSFQVVFTAASATDGPNSSNNSTHGMLDLSHGRLKGWIVDVSSNPNLTSIKGSIEALNVSFNSMGAELVKIKPSEPLLSRMKRLLVLDLSNNDLMSLGKSDFNDLNSLTHLNLSRNGLSKLQSSLFTRTSALIHVDLSFNRFKDIDSYFLKPLRFLRTIYFDHNAIESIAKSAFKTSSRLRRLGLSYNSIPEVPKDFMVDYRLLEWINLSHNNISNMSSHGFKQLFQIEINLSHNLIERIPRFAFVEVSNITILDLSHNRLKILEPEAFDTTDVCHLNLSYNLIEDASKVPITNLTGIKILDVSHNQILKIDRKSFTPKLNPGQSSIKFYEMSFIDLSHNNISEVTGSIFDRFWALRALNLNNNKIKRLASGSFGNLPTLLEMNLDDNLNLTDINSGALLGLISLKDLYVRRCSLKRAPTVPVALNHLDLSNNNISHVTCPSFPMMNSLISINLDHNRIKKLQPDSFCNLLTLNSLSLSSNLISNIESDVAPAIAKLSSLQKLDLSYNSIIFNNSNASSLFGTMFTLFYLNLSSNFIDSIPGHTFNGLIQLLQLNLSHNQLDLTSSESFKGLVSLEELDLGYNSITKTGNRSNCFLEDLLSCQKVSLRANQLSYIHKKSFPSNEYYKYKIRELDLSHNNIESLSVTEGFQTIQSLNLSRNNFRKLIPGIFGNFSSLDSLDMSFNRLSKIEFGSFSPYSGISGASGRSDQSSRLGSSVNPSINNVRHLRSINLSNNQIVSVDSRELLFLMSSKNDSGLKEMDISMNPLTEQRCQSQIYSRLKRKGLMIRHDDLMNGSDLNGGSTDGSDGSGVSDVRSPRKEESSEECNQWISHEFRISIPASLKVSNSATIVPITSLSFTVASIIITSIIIRISMFPDAAMIPLWYIPDPLLIWFKPWSTRWFHIWLNPISPRSVHFMVAFLHHLFWSPPWILRW